MNRLTAVEQQMYSVSVDWAPPYELITSLAAYAGWRQYRLLDLGGSWVRGVASKIGVQLASRIAEGDIVPVMSLLFTLVPDVPGDRSVDTFLSWFSGLSSGDLYELLAPRVDQMDPVRDLATLHADVLTTLTTWNDRYFAHIDRAILAGLASEAESMRTLAAALPPMEAAERATKGVVYPARRGLDSILLVPQYHFRPWNVHSWFRGTQIITYPADVVPPAPGEPPFELVRIARALADDSRLRILHFLSGRTRSFGEIVQHAGLAKSTVHHHMVALRAAGLVRVYESGEKSSAYSLRPDTVDTLSESLRGFLAEGTTTL